MKNEDREWLAGEFDPEMELEEEEKLEDELIYQS